MAVNTVILKDSCLHTWMLKHCTPKRTLFQHSQIWSWQEMNLRPTASHHSRWCSAQPSQPSARLDKCYYWTRTSLLSTPSKSSKRVSLGLLLQDWHLCSNRVAWGKSMKCHDAEGIWSTTIHLPVESPTIAEIHPPWQKNKCLLHNIRLNNTKCSSHPWPGTLLQQICQNPPYCLCQTTVIEQYILHPTVNIP